MSSKGGVPVVMCLVGELAYKIGVSNLKDSHAGRLWEHALDEKWKIQVNPNPVEVQAIPAWGMAFFYNGWPMGVVNAGGGEIIQHEKVNEKRLIAALRMAIKKASASKQEPLPLK